MQHAKEGDGSGVSNQGLAIERFCKPAQAQDKQDAIQMHKPICKMQYKCTHQSIKDNNQDARATIKIQHAKEGGGSGFVCYC